MPQYNPIHLLREAKCMLLSYFDYSNDLITMPNTNITKKTQKQKNPQQKNKTPNNLQYYDI